MGEGHDKGQWGGNGDIGVHGRKGRSRRGIERGERGKLGKTGWGRGIRNGVDLQETRKSYIFM